MAPLSRARRSPDRGARPVVTRFALPVAPPFRLDLTVHALRRVPSNVVDVLTASGDYLHAFAAAKGPGIVRVAQPRPEALAVTITRRVRNAADDRRVLALLRRTLGIDRDLTAFYAAASRLRWLAPLARRMRGIKPPRYRSLWEACVNSIVFQQVSLHAATAVVRRLVTTFGASVAGVDEPLYVFPEVGRVLRASDAELRALGLSAAKVATLRRIGETIAAGTLSEAMIEARPSNEAAELLCTVKGIGPWTASVILLRGFGRLDVFPGNDSGVARSFALVAGDGATAVDDVVGALAPQQGMLYFHLLLARLESRGDIGR